MNLSEFKAWFEGFSENLDGPPGPKAWERIQAKIKEIKDAPPTTYPVFVDRYRPYSPPYWQPLWQYGGGGGGVGIGSTAVSSAQSEMMKAYQQKLGDAGSRTLCGAAVDGGSVLAWNSADGYRDLGRAEAASVSSA